MVSSETRIADRGGVAALHPQVNTDPTLCSCSERARLLFVGILTLLDAEGRMRPAKGILLEEHLRRTTSLTDQPPEVIRVALEELERRELLRLEARGALYVPRFAKLQAVGTAMLVERWRAHGVGIATSTTTHPVVTPCIIAFRAPETEEERLARLKAQKARRNERYKAKVRLRKMATGATADESFVASSCTLLTPLETRSVCASASSACLLRVSSASPGRVSGSRWPRLRVSAPASPPRACVRSDPDPSESESLVESRTSGPPAASSSDARAAAGDATPASTTVKTGDATETRPVKTEDAESPPKPVPSSDPEDILSRIMRSTNLMFKAGAGLPALKEIRRLDESLTRLGYPTDRWEVFGEFIIAGGFK